MKTLLTTLTAFFAAAVLALFSWIGAVLFEKDTVPPVSRLVFDAFYCRGDDVIITGVLDKTEYPGGKEAQLLSLNFFTTDSPATRIPWRRVVEEDGSSFSRPAGLQTVEVYLIGGCGLEFVAKTKHKSPITGLAIPGTWGPFGPANGENDGR